MKKKNNSHNFAGAARNLIRMLPSINAEIIFLV